MRCFAVLLEGGIQITAFCRNDDRCGESLQTGGEGRGLYNVAMPKYICSMVMNVLVPGTGVIVLGRPWLGMAVAIWFGFSAEWVLFGWLITPASATTTLLVLGWVSAIGAWLFGQGVYIHRRRFLRDPNLPRDVKSLCRLADESLAGNDYAAARSALRVAMEIDDSNLDVHLLWARLMTRIAKRSRARRAWIRVEKLDERHVYIHEIQDNLDRLSAV